MSEVLIAKDNVSGVKAILKQMLETGSVLSKDMKRLDNLAAVKIAMRDNGLAQTNGLRGPVASWSITKAGRRYIDA